ncbi:MAG TPA: glycosyltransferase family 4 protein [Chloroflexia bacterium]|nr:glycosyltransferase family 4 protein [Chloroflexia bacterium]
MKVALYNVTTTTKVGGVETFVWEVAARLGARGYQVDVIGGRGPERRPAPGVRIITLPYIDRAAWRRIPLLGRQYTLTKLLERWSFALAGLPYLLWHRYDIVHIQKPFDLPVAALCRLAGARALFGCHGKDFWPGDRLFTRWMHDAVSCSAYNAAQVSAHYGIEATVIYNGVDLEQFPPMPETTQPGDGQPRPRIVLFAGRLVRWKGVEYLIRALPRLHTPDVQVWIAGEGPYQPELEALAAREGVADRVRFLGNMATPQLVDLYHTADVLAATSFVNETFGIALCEAMACGLPVVASRFGGFSEVVDDGVTGYLATPQDPADLAAKLDHVLADPAAARRMGAAGLDRVRRLFTWDAVVDRLEPVYKRLTA